jgi:hypothetical protein
MSDAIIPFKVEIGSAGIEDLRRRLAATRWPDRETTGDWSQGIPLAYMREVCTYWATQYDMRRIEAPERLPAVPHRIDGLGIHFMHVRSPHAAGAAAGDDARLAGLGDRIPQRDRGPLTDPVAHGGEAKDAFHVVCPRIAGLRLLRQTARQGLEASNASAAPGAS